MKFTSVFLFSLFITAFSSSIYSQSKNFNLLGIGVSYDFARTTHITYYYYTPYASEVPLVPSQINIDLPILFYIPLNLTPNFRIEPAFGINSMKSGNTSSTSDINNYSSIVTNSYDASVATIGLSGYYIFLISNSLSVYLGPRFNLSFCSTDSKNDYDYLNNGMYSHSAYETITKETDITTGLAFGAEYYPIKNFSFGAEANFNYISYGNPDISNTTSPPPQPSTSTSTSSRTQHSFNTGGMICIRWYFL